MREADSEVAGVAGVPVQYSLQYSEVAGVADVLEHGLEGEHGGLRRPVVRPVLDPRRVGAVHCNSQ